MAVRANATRVTITMTNAILERVDEYAEELGISRASAISVLCSSMLNSIDMTKSLKRIEKEEVVEGRRGS